MNPQEHKSALRRLNAISKLLDLNQFFTASINHWGKVNLQGDFDKKIVKFAIEHKFAISANKTLGYITLTRGNIEINLI